MFLLSLRQHLKDSYFVDGGNATRAGIIDYLFKNRATYLLIDEIDKMSPRDQTFLLNLMETGIITEMKYGKTREAEIKTSVFATCNDCRAVIVELEQYTYEQFYEITVRPLDVKREIALLVADTLWDRSKNLRCVRIGKLARSEEDVNFLIEKFLYR
jgi:MoxR-like ATPase